MSETVRFEENAACGQCGRYGVYVFATEQLCLECYESRGSCCAEFHPNCSTPPAKHTADAVPVEPAKRIGTNLQSRMSRPD